VLDRLKLFKKISEVGVRLFPTNYDQIDLARKIWLQICKDGSFLSKINNSKSSFLLPNWIGKLDDSFYIESNLTNYSVLAVDGSQIYPDRHMAGVSCFLINIGGIFLNYSKDNSKVDIFSEPQVFLQDDIISDNSGSLKEVVDFKREELELWGAIKKSKLLNPTLCLFDGTLIFWSLEGVGKELKNKFLEMYFSNLQQFYENKILMAGYISFPKSRELLNLIKIGLCRFRYADCIECHRGFSTFPCKQIDSLIDINVTKFFLQASSRTTIFESKSKIILEYPDNLKPYFFYLDVGSEIARIEIPAWIAKDENYIDLICKIVIDQVKKGAGYPICLAEAHNQAVVKGEDRDFFYNLIYKVGIESNKQVSSSQKSIKKKILGF